MATALKKAVESPTSILPWKPCLFKVTGVEPGKRCAPLLPSKPGLCRDDIACGDALVLAQSGSGRGVNVISGKRVFANPAYPRNGPRGCELGQAASSNCREGGIYIGSRQTDTRPAPSLAASCIESTKVHWSAKDVMRDKPVCAYNHDIRLRTNVPAIRSAADLPSYDGAQPTRMIAMSTKRFDQTVRRLGRRVAGFPNGFSLENFMLCVLELVILCKAIHGSIVVTQTVFAQATELRDHRLVSVHAGSLTNDTINKSLWMTDGNYQRCRFNFGS